MVQAEQGPPGTDAPQPSAPVRQEAAAAPADVPDRPQLAPGVELSGSMEESGFTEQQSLIQRNGQFVQVTALLYHVAEQIDGQKTLDEIAAGVSDAINRRVSADNIRQLLQSKLIPLGIVLGADGKVAASAAGPGRGLSPLRVNLKMGIISPRLIDPATGIFQVLYWPLILVIVLAAASAALTWLFVIHGIGASVRNVIYQPGYLLAALGLIVIAAAFHEFGHASALRYGGGKVREMGFGIYLIYPAFYTDVSDNYRLGRWARVRTDLGGFYFNLLFALALIGAYFATHIEFLLLVVVLVAFDIFRQLMPFVRLDGYWALADVTGIPDFFSHMGAFLRTVLPLPFWKGPKLANLKAWVKAVYALYILITVPLLLLLLFGMLRGVPRILATAWDSFGRLSGQFASAHSHGSVLGMIATAVQVLTLALPTFGTIFILFSLARRLITGGWSWSKGSPKRRTIAGAGGVALVALLLYLWVPAGPGGPLTLLRRGKTGTVQAQSSWRPIGPSDRGTVVDAAAAVPWVGTRWVSHEDTVAAIAPRPGPARAAAPAREAQAAPATPSATATATATVSATPSATASATASAAASPAPRATPPIAVAAPVAPAAATPLSGTPVNIAERTPAAVSGGRAVPVTAPGESAASGVSNGAGVAPSGSSGAVPAASGATTRRAPATQTVAGAGAGASVSTAAGAGALVTPTATPASAVRP